MSILDGYIATLYKDVSICWSIDKSMNLLVCNDFVILAKSAGKGMSVCPVVHLPAGLSICLSKTTNEMK